ncbi:uncharacterized protein LOC131320416 isoform X2 [Rhododendron vialii]|uniref:uncharacterized protein LOC131320416 isoform X2 n=1 Tax=Rhododendron vialii TaxID=182163 RepID=UPI00266056CC|nr:uncharacterized protein LOC131320416 isoform X2 [Rhododendron vialii]
MSGAGAPDFFYREAQRLGYVARSAFKLFQMQKQYKLIKPGSSVLDLGCAPGAWLQVACQSLGPLKTGGVVVGIDLKKVKVPSLYCDARVQTVCADVMNLPRHQVRALSPQGCRIGLIPFPLECSVIKQEECSSAFVSLGLSSMQQGFSVILSDMCPLVSGINIKDAALSAELGMRALDLAVGSGALSDIDTNDMDREGLSDGSASGSNDGGVLRPGGHLVIKLLESEDVKEFSGICKLLFRKASWLRPKATRSSSREIYLICQSLLPLVGTKSTP